MEQQGRSYSAITVYFVLSKIPVILFADISVSRSCSVSPDRSNPGFVSPIRSGPMLIFSTPFSYDSDSVHVGASGSGDVVTRHISITWKRCTQGLDEKKINTAYLGTLSTEEIQSDTVWDSLTNHLQKAARRVCLQLTIHRIQQSIHTAQLNTRKRRRNYDIILPRQKTNID